MTGWESLAKRYASTVIDGVGAAVETGASVLAANFAIKSGAAALIAPILSYVNKSRPPPAATKPLDDHLDYGF